MTDNGVELGAKGGGGGVAEPGPEHPPLSRRQFLGAALAGGAAVTLAACGGPTSGGSLRPSGTTPAVLRKPGSLPRPSLPAGTDTMPQIEHIVVVMMENHSYDNWLGMLGRGDGFKLDSHGQPTATNPDGQGNLVRAFHMPTPCQLPTKPSQSWNASHIQYDGGRIDGFVRSDSGPVAMGYWTGADLPFSYSLARTFPVADRYFASTMGQTYPNRRYLMAATSLGLVSDPTPTPVRPPNGTIFDALDSHGISWRNYYSDVPSVLILPIVASGPNAKTSIAPIDSYYRDAAAGTLPGFSIVDPNFSTSSEENPQDILEGEVFVSKVVNAAMSGPGWSKTLLIWCYDEHGGYYDHVPPPSAVKPDDVPPDIKVPPDQPGGFDRYGFRVPCVVVSPYARQDYVSGVVRDHTSILKLVETKWNLPAMTYRDANANGFEDMIDLNRSPAFLHPPTLASPLDPATSTCPATGPGQIPPPGAVVPAGH